MPAIWMNGRRVLMNIGNRFKYERKKKLSIILNSAKEQV